MRWHAVAAGAVLLLGCQTPPPELEREPTPTAEPTEPTEPLTGSVRVEDPAGDVTDDAGSLLWSVELFADGEALYVVTAQRVGARLVAALLDWQTTEQHPLPDPPGVEGALLTLVVPADLLPRIDGPFEWTALTQLDGAYEDRLEGRARFP